jgi:putative aminopeptidase FrvX
LGGVMDKTAEFLKEITEVSGVPGYEYLAGLGEIQTDNIGSILCKKTGTADSPRIMIDGHLDEIGFMVKLIDDNGFIRFTPLGGWFDQVMLAQRVVIETSKGPVVGIIGAKPPHLLTADERKKVVEKKDMYIDVGAKDKKEAEGKLGIKVGDPIIPWSPFEVMANGKCYLAKGWDDRVGCAVAVDVLRALQNVKHPNTVLGAGSAQEEVGLRGATTSVEVADPDVGIAVESGIAGDTPGIKPEEAQSKLGAGVGILMYDASMIPNLKLRDLAIKTAKAKRIRYQVDVLERGGTDAHKIHLHKAGVPSIVLGVPIRYIHSHAGIMHRDDYDACVRLVVELVKVLDSKTVRSLTR